MTGCPRTDREALAALQARRDWIWISGNHDPALPSDLGGVVAERSRDRPDRVPPRADRRSAKSPAICIPRRGCPTRGRSMERRCFACDGERAVMPAFGAYTGGLSIRDAAFAKIFGTPGFMAHVLGDGRPRRPAERCLRMEAALTIAGASFARPSYAREPLRQSFRNTIDAIQPVISAIKAVTSP